MPITQAQIDELKLEVAALSRSVGALVADGPVPPPGVGVWTEYNGAYFGAKAFKPVLVDAQGVPIISGGGTVPAAGYVSLACPPGEGMAVWGTSAEHYKVVTSPQGDEWGMVTAYENVALSQRYPLETIRAEWINLDTGVVRDISRLTPAGATGTAMCPQATPGTGRYRIREWFYTCNPDGSRSNPCYWEEEFQFGLTVTNPAWIGGGANSRQAIGLKEAWWNPPDATHPLGSWIRGHPLDPNKLPWVNGQPADPGMMVYTGYQALGRAVGSLWVFQYGLVAASPGFDRQDEYRIGLASIT